MTHGNLVRVSRVGVSMAAFVLMGSPVLVRAQAAPVAPAPVAAPPLVVESAPVSEPIAGVSDGTIFLRSPDNNFVFFPNGRLQLDSYFFHSDS